MKKIFCAIGVVCVVVSFVLMRQRGNAVSINAFHDTPRIGFVIALSGANASAGRPIANTIKILRRKYPGVEFLIEDSKSTATMGVQAAKKLLDVDKVDMLYCDLSNVTASLIPLTEKKERILVATVFMQDFIDLGKYTLRNFMTIENQATVALKEIAKQIPTCKTASLAVSNDEVGRASIEGFDRAIKQTGHRLEHTYMFNTSDLKSVAAVAARTSSDFIYVSSFTSTLGQFIKELRSNGYAGKIVTSTAITFPFIRDAAGDAVKGIIHTDFPKTEKYTQLKELYEKEFHEAPPLTVFLCHDGMSMIIETLLRIKPKTNGDLLTAMEGCECSGAYGKLNCVGREIVYPLVTIVEK